MSAAISSPNSPPAKEPSPVLLTSAFRQDRSRKTVSLGFNAFNKDATELKTDKKTKRYSRGGYNYSNKNKQNCFNTPKGETHDPKESFNGLNSKHTTPRSSWGVAKEGSYIPPRSRSPSITNAYVPPSRRNKAPSEKAFISPSTRRKSSATILTVAEGTEGATNDGEENKNVYIPPSLAANRRRSSQMEIFSDKRKSSTTSRKSSLGNIDSIGELETSPKRKSSLANALEPKGGDEVIFTPSKPNTPNRRRHAIDQLQFSPTTEHDIATFLRRTRLHKYTQTFEKALSFKEFLQIDSDAKLIELGVDAKGARERLLQAIKRYCGQQMEWRAFGLIDENNNLIAKPVTKLPGVPQSLQNQGGELYGLGNYFNNNASNQNFFAHRRRSSVPLRSPSMQLANDLAEFYLGGKIESEGALLVQLLEEENIVRRTSLLQQNSVLHPFRLNATGNPDETTARDSISSMSSTGGESDFNFTSVDHGTFNLENNRYEETKYTAAPIGPRRRSSWSTSTFSSSELFSFPTLT
eukprot:Awhi_evm1s13811